MPAPKPDTESNAGSEPRLLLYFTILMKKDNERGYDLRSVLLYFISVFPEDHGNLTTMKTTNLSDHLTEEDFRRRSRIYIIGLFKYYNLPCNLLVLLFGRIISIY